MSAVQRAVDGVRHQFGSQPCLSHNIILDCHERFHYALALNYGSPLLKMTVNCDRRGDELTLSSLLYMPWTAKKVDLLYMQPQC